MRSALRLVWALDVRHLVAHRTRLALSALGIAVGVALAVGVGSLSSSIQSSLQSIAQAAASTANIEVRPNGSAGLKPDVLGRVRDTRGVVHAGATVESYVQLRARGRHARTFLIGIDDGIIAMTPLSIDARTLRNADLTGLWLPSSVAKDLGVGLRDTIEVTTPSGWRRAAVGAVLPASASGRSRVVVGTVGVVQQVLGRGTTYDAIYVQVKDPATALARVASAAGPSARAGPIGFRNSQLQELLAGANASFNVGTIVALFVGAFLVYNTMSMAAVERLREAALLRAVGAKRRQVFALFCAEGALLGIIGSALGIVFGVVLSARLLTQQGGALEKIYPVQITKLSISPRVLLAAGVAGVVASIAAALLPARRISRADPAPALGPAGVLEDPTRGPRRAITVVGVLCCAAGPAIAVPTSHGGNASPITLGGFAITMLGVALLIPTVVPLVARIALSWVRRAGTPNVRLAAGEVLRAPGRTAFTVGAVLLSLAIVVGFSVGQSSFIRAFDVSFKGIIAADLYVRTPTWRIFGSDVPLDTKLATEIEKIPGVEGSWPFRLMPGATLRGRSILVLAYDADKYAKYARLSGRDKRDRYNEAVALRDPDSVIASPSLRTQLGYGVGSSFRLSTPTGMHTLRVAGTLNDPSAINPEIIFSTKEFERIWGTGGADSFGVRVHDVQQVPQVKAAILRALGPRYGITVDTTAQYRKRLSGVVTSVTQLISSVQLIAVIVAALGLANTLLISTFERRRDLGVLRAVGMFRRQLRRMVAAEALMIGGLGVVLAWGLGTLIGYGIYTLIQAQLGVPLRFAPPVQVYLLTAVLGIVASLLASLYPAQRAARIDVVEALQYE